MRIAALFLACLLFSYPAMADEQTQFEDGSAVQVRSDTAYLLVRELVKDGEEGFAFDVVFVRALSADELSAAAERFKQDGRRSFDENEPNVVQMHGAKPYATAGEEKDFVVPVKPGTYLIAEQSFGYNGTCMCMGTVKFEAKAGVVTDLGFVLGARSDKPTTIPELAHYIAGKNTNGDILPFVLTVRPYAASMTIPGALKAAPRVSADYHAVNRFPNYFGALIDRMEPVPGVLDYDKDGRVLDLKANAVPPPVTGK